MPFSVHALSEDTLRHYHQYNIYFYGDDMGEGIEPEPGPCEDACAIDGDSREAIIWNYILGLGISGLSDNPAAIAGILGNMSVETASTLSPFVQNSSGYTGLIQWSPKYYSDIISQIKTRYGDYLWTHGKDSEPDVDPETVKEAIIFELDLLFGMSSVNGFISNLGVPTNQTGAQGARAYADLFLVLVERAVGGDDEIEDPGVKAIASSSKYQDAEKRRSRAEEFYNEYGNCESGGSGGGGTVSDVTWTDGFIDAQTFTGYIKEVPDPGWSNETENRAYVTNGPNKILLHSTEGQQAGLAAYPSGNHYAAHFTIDPKNKRVFQHYSIYVASNAIKSYDTYGPIQIEIVAFSQGHEDNPYNFRNYTEDDWDYLVLLLSAISQETGIPLSTSVNWESPVRLSSTAFRDYTGIIGHMHAPANDHVDPGNIWPMLSAALERGPGIMPRPCAEEETFEEGSFEEE